jgi:hypothetical protein
MKRTHLFLDSANGSDCTAKGDLAGHSDSRDGRNVEHCGCGKEGGSDQ